MGISVMGDVETVVGWNGTILHTTTGGEIGEIGSRSD